MIDLISAGATLAGGAYSAYANKRAEDRAYNRQKEFAQHGIAWRVEDAKRAGIHPLAALGAQTTSFSPSFVGDSVGPSIAAAGQHLGRALYATRTYQQRKEMLDLKKDELQNQLLAAQLALVRSQTGPPLPSNSLMNPPLVGAGQGDAAYVEEVPLRKTHSQPGRPGQEVGYIDDYSYTRTPEGYAVVPSKEMKERMEDSIIPETMWSIRNLLIPMLKGGPPAPNPKYYPLPTGYDYWEWKPLLQEFRPARAPWRPRQKGKKLPTIKG